MKNNDDLIFRYRSGNELSLKELMNGEFFFAGNNELNDPTEAKPLYIFAGKPELWIRFVDYILFKTKIYLLSIYEGRYLIKSLEKLIEKSDKIAVNLNKRKLYSRINQYNIISYFINEIIKLNILSEVKQNIIIQIIDEIILEWVLRILEENTQYIVSFSKSATNPTMWGHYANAYKGFCLIFKPNRNKIRIQSTYREFTTSKKIKGIHTLGCYDNKIDINVSEVKYSTKIPKINAFNVISDKFYYSEEEDHYDVPANICSGIPDYSEKLFGLVKFKDWKYEQEIRCLLPFKMHRFIRNNNNIPMDTSNYNSIPENRIYMYNPVHLCGVIIGSKTNDLMVKRITEAIRIMRRKNSKFFNLKKNSLKNVYILKAENKRKEYSLSIEPYGVVFKNDDYLDYGSIEDNEIKKEIVRMAKDCNQN